VTFGKNETTCNWKISNFSFFKCEVLSSFARHNFLYFLLFHTDQSILKWPSQFSSRAIRTVYSKINLPINNSLSSCTVVLRGPISGAYAVRHLDRISSLIYAIRHDDSEHSAHLPLVWSARICEALVEFCLVVCSRLTAPALRDPFLRLPHVQKHFNCRLVSTGRF